MGSASRTFVNGVRFVSGEIIAVGGGLLAQVIGDTVVLSTRFEAVSSHPSAFSERGLGVV
jgi:hypothetical protein